ncbi:TetR/AcrR family transcriptional regulator [Paraburkholderia adhaesiva]|uniref:TetR/AcrR family transcriptional regulator n=1 Tax=Paraburkholderia adhaesiva TaxID=2883244 RepID=UPI001F31FBA8|nr:TetR/AcrR family transcriptional regulator [Paraburkholderia adhaesiva]
MARPLSPEKRNALLLSATHAVAEQGVLATTASIARRAGVAEGTLFTYFENKDVLFQELYLHLKHELAETVMPDYPYQADYRLRMAHIFQRYVSWGLTNTAGRLAISRLAASGQLLDGTRARGTEPFQAVSRMMEDAVQEGVLLNAPIAFLYSIIERIADTTIEYIDKQPADAERHRQLGFHAAWRAITP